MSAKRLSGDAFRNSTRPLSNISRIYGVVPNDGLILYLARKYPILIDQPHPHSPLPLKGRAITTFLPLRAAQALSAASKEEVRACPVLDTGRGMGICKPPFASDSNDESRSLPSCHDSFY
jgi:hypothetical protein